MQGIYAIEHVSSGRRYIGSSIDLRRRWIEHQRELTCNRHANKHLQYAWNKYGAVAFVFVIVEEVWNVQDLLRREQFYVDDCSAKYNIAEVVGRPSVQTGPQKPEHKAKRIAALIGFKHSDQTRANMSAAQKKRTFGKPPINRRARPRMSDETRAKLSAALKGRSQSLEHREKRGAARRAAWDRWRAENARPEMIVH